MCFLDSLRILRGHVEQEVDFAGERATRFPGESDKVSAAGAASLYATHYVRACAASGKGHENVLWSDERFDLPGENAFESVVIAGCGEDGWVGSQR